MRVKQCMVPAIAPAKSRPTDGTIKVALYCYVLEKYRVLAEVLVKLAYSE